MMEQRDKIRPFSSRLVRWLTISLFITISGISYLVYLMVSTVMTDVTCTQRMHELDYTIERIKALAESLLLQKQHQPERLINAMTDAVRQFVGDAERSDDLTMLAIQLKTTS